MENVVFVRDWVVKLATWYTEWWWNLCEESPFHVAMETSLILFILWVLFFKKSYNPEVKGYGGRAPAPLSAKEKQTLINEWEPVPLVPKLQVDSAKVWSDRVTVRQFVSPTHVLVEGSDDQKLNMASNDFLGLSADDSQKQIASDSLDDYGLGSCGPRGFYGTTKAHADLEAALADFMGTPEAIIYADAVSCVASAVPAFSKRGDLLIVDDKINHALRTGCKLSRSKVVYFKHNDMEDLERVLKAACKRHRSVAATQRRFIVFEGLYREDGSIAKLKDLVRLGKKYKVRLMCDESLSWGVLGDTGHGVTEHFDLPVLSIDVIIASLAASLGSVGGFCVGNREVTDHQRLSGAGYCFSASAPPFTCATAQAALEKIKTTPGLLATLRTRGNQVREAVSEMEHVEVVSDANSPVVHVRVAADQQLSYTDARHKLNAIARKCLARGVLIARNYDMPEDFGKVAPGLRVQATAAMSEEDVEEAMQVLAEAVEEVFDADAAASADGEQEGEGEEEEEKTASAGAGAGSGGRRTKGKTTRATRTRNTAAPSRQRATRTRKSTGGTRSSRTAAAAAAAPEPLRRSTRRRKPRKLD